MSNEKNNSIKRNPTRKSSWIIIIIICLRHLTYTSYFTNKAINIIYRWISVWRNHLWYLSWHTRKAMSIFLYISKYVLPKNKWAATEATTVQQPEIIFANSFPCVENPYMARTHYFTTQWLILTCISVLFE